MVNKEGLKRCPFCGSHRVKIEVKNNGSRYINEFGHRISYKIASARCKTCYARGSTAGGLVADNGIDRARIEGKYVTIECDDSYLRQRAAELWNERVWYE